MKINMKRGSQVSLYMMLKRIKQHLNSVHKKVNSNYADLKRRRCLQKKRVLQYIFSKVLSRASAKNKSLGA